MWLPVLFDFNLQKPCRPVPYHLDRLNKKKKKGESCTRFLISSRRKKEFVIEAIRLNLDFKQNEHPVSHCFDM